MFVIGKYEGNSQIAENFGAEVKNVNKTQLNLKILLMLIKYKLPELRCYQTTRNKNRGRDIYNE